MPRLTRSSQYLAHALGHAASYSLRADAQGRAVDSAGVAAGEEAAAEEEATAAAAHW